jgi:hypothetical protein
MNCALIRKRARSSKGETERPTLRSNRVRSARIERLTIIARHCMRHCCRIFPGHSRTRLDRQASGTTCKGATTVCDDHHRLRIACLSGCRRGSSGCAGRGRSPSVPVEPPPQAARSTSTLSAIRKNQTSLSCFRAGNIPEVMDWFIHLFFLLSAMVLRQTRCADMPDATNPFACRLARTRIT